MKKALQAWIITLGLLLSSQAVADPSELIQLANQGDRAAQYQLGVDYQTGHNLTINLNDAFYWFQQAAQQGHPQAMQQLANAYQHGLGTEADTTQALYWLTRQLLSGDSNAAMAIGQLYESLDSSPAPSAMAELWYHSLADQNPQAEQRYSAILQQQFDQQRARQVASIEQLESAINQTTAAAQNQNSTQSAPQTPSLMSDYLFVVLCILVLIAGLSVYRYVKKSNKQQTQHQNSLNESLSQKDNLLKQQKRQLDTLYHQLKKMQNHQSRQTQDQKLHLACAMFGFAPGQLPEERQIKIRYKQLSKIYHPDMKGSEEEMKRLNGAMKVLINEVNKSLNKVSSN
ncbi:J domain-containing protein [Vibrio ostreae]|uniref:SEL1-like repeat protein n=1 Tax=Vibrio ostreae TaxID=2841925 RepID=A0A975YPW5_9VIBR|nr:SEL1-like repeat protein [Vibrio ostreae]QXO18945.1 SEL1-like repeat protein [Vibrio ostreae]